MKASRFRFGIYQLDLERRELLRAGVRVRLAAQPMSLLALLVSRAPETVGREEIRRSLWPSDVHVEFDQGINACMKQIRAVLRDRAEAPEVIETVPRGGYRLLLPVEAVEAESTPPAPRVGRTKWKTAAWAAVVVTGLLLVGAVVRSGLGGRASSTEPPVLAVLPFEDFSEEQDSPLFRDALVDELITQLGRRYRSRILVIARTSVMKYAGTREDVTSIGRELGADYILEGSLHRAGGKTRVVAQLIRVRDRSHVWASAFQRTSEDLLALQVDLGTTIAKGLALNLAPDARGMAGATRPEAYEAYLHGRQLLSEQKIREARAALERAVALDPTFAQGWASLAQVLSMVGPRGEKSTGALEAVQRALALDDELPEAYLMLAMMRFYRDYDLEAARSAFTRAIELNPGFALAHQGFAAYYSVLGRHDEAIAEIQRARRLDPLSTMTNSDVGWYYYFAHRYDEAIDHSERTLALDPDFFWANLCIQLSYLQRPDRAGAIEHARREMTRAGASRERIDRLASLDGSAALQDYWRWRLEAIEEQRGKAPLDPSILAQTYMALGERERALEQLEASFEIRTGWILPFLSVDPLFDPLRSDPRFRDLVARIGSGSAAPV